MRYADVQKAALQVPGIERSLAMRDTQNRRFPSYATWNVKLCIMALLLRDSPLRTLPATYGTRERPCPRGASLWIAGSARRYRLPPAHWGRHRHGGARAR